MPELPEVETMRRGIQAVVGQRITAVCFVRSSYRPIQVQPVRRKWKSLVNGETILGTDRIGKRVLLGLSSGASIVFEPRMTGLVLISAPPNSVHLRVRFELAGVGAQQLLFWDRRGLGTMTLVTPAELAAVRRRLGKDALRSTYRDLMVAFGDSRRAVKVALLDQSKLAGVGNLYAAEILFAAGVDPRRPCCELSSDEWSSIARQMRRILKKAIAYEGSTLSDGTYRNALNQSGSYQNHHQVYDRADEPCPRCRNVHVRRIVQAQRATFFCPACQR